ncbi:MAG: VWA domain-containing protein [Thermoguttaceae bacterium]
MTLPALILMRPSALVWALPAAAVVIALYRRAMPVPRVTTARPLLWQQVLGAPRTSGAPWRRRRIRSVAIHVGVILLAALAASDPCLRRPRTVVMILDNSRSMQAIDDGSRRLDRAKDLLAAELQSLGHREHTAIITTAGGPVLVLAAHSDREHAQDLASRVRAADLPSRMAEALELAKGQAAPGTRLETHVFSDGCFDGAAAKKWDPGVVIHAVGASSANAAVTRLAVRRYPGDDRRFQAIVEVTSRTGAALAAPLEIRIDGKPIHNELCRLEAQGSATIVAELQSPSGGLVEAVLDLNDSLPDDNRLAAALPPFATLLNDREAFPEDPRPSGADHLNSSGSSLRQAALPPRSPALRAGTSSIPDPRPSGADHLNPSGSSLWLAALPPCDTRSPPQWCGRPPEPAEGPAPPLWPWLLVAAASLLAAEWAMYHRQSTC